MMELEGVEGIPRIEWNEMLPDYPSDPIKKVKMLSEIAIGNKPLVSWDELREMAQLPTIEKNAITTLSSEKPGILLNEPYGELIRNKLKTSIIDSKLYSSMVGIPLYLISGNLTYGIIRLKEPKKITLDDFKKSRNNHKMSDNERESLWPEIKNLWDYEFEIIDLFKKPAKTKILHGDQTFIKNVEFLKDWVEVK